MMKYPVKTIAIVASAPIVAICVALLAHAVSISPLAVRDDALGMATCLIAILGVALVKQRSGE
jgi:hypothetical protein